jgi:hypothetical protein
MSAFSLSTALRRAGQVRRMIDAEVRRPASDRVRLMRLKALWLRAQSRLRAAAAGRGDAITA